MIPPPVPGRFPKHFRGPPKLSTPPDNRGVQQAALGKLDQQRRKRFVQLGQLPPHRLKVLFVRIPSLVVDGHVGHAALHQPPGHEAGLPERGLPVAVPHLILFLGQIKHLSGVAEDQVVSLLFALGKRRNPVVAARGHLERVQVVQQLTAFFLAFVGDPLRHHALDRKPRLGRVAACGKRLVPVPQKSGFGKTPLQFGKHHVGRNQPLVTSIVPLEQAHHRAHGWINLPVARFAPGLNHVRGRLVRVHPVRHRADNRILVCLFRQQGEHLANLYAVHVRSDRLFIRPDVIPPGSRLGIKGIEMRRSAPAPDLDHGFGRGLFGRCPRAKLRAAGHPKPGRARRRPPQRLAP